MLGGTAGTLRMAHSTSPQHSMQTHRLCSLLLTAAATHTDAAREPLPPTHTRGHTRRQKFSRFNATSNTQCPALNASTEPSSLTWRPGAAEAAALAPSSAAHYTIAGTNRTRAGLRGALMAPLLLLHGSMGTYASRRMRVMRLLLLAMPHRLAQLTIQGGRSSVTSVSAQCGNLQEEEARQ